MTMYPTVTNLYTNHCASGDASFIAKVSGIKNVFPFILLFFASSFFVPGVNLNKWRQTGVYLPTSYRSSPSPSLLSPVPRLHFCRRLHLPVSKSPMSMLSHISAAAIVRCPSPPLNHGPFPLCISTRFHNVSNYPPFLSLPPPPPSVYFHPFSQCF